MLRRLITFWSKRGISDANALAFYTEILALGGNLTPREQTAVDNLVIDLKTAGLWSKIRVLYPFVGQSAVSHSLNLVNPLEFQIDWYGTLTHNSSGVVTDGVTGYGNTNLPCVRIQTGNIPPQSNSPYLHASAYIKNVTVTNNNYGFIFGSNYSLVGYSEDYGTSITLSNFAGIKKVTANGGDATYSPPVESPWGPSYTILTYSGLYTVTSNLLEPNSMPVGPYSGIIRTYKDTTELGSRGMNWITSSGTAAPYGSQADSGILSQGAVYIGGSHFTDRAIGPAPLNDRMEKPLAATYSFACFGEFLTGSEVTQLNTIVSDFQTYLNR
ncbi:hypothetical protein EBZ38_03220 [bacterium]|nr:hypothetical protein [bacterium]NDC93972.1 hypothetical protein [bacterium]NDD83277.1 hypothetical protein [bacterium]